MTLQVQNISHLISNLRTELKLIQESEEFDKNFPPSFSSGAASAGRLVLDAEKDILDCVGAKNYGAALHRARNYWYVCIALL